jgi:Ca-activated chloride channel family protein
MSRRLAWFSVLIGFLFLGAAAFSGQAVAASPAKAKSASGPATVMFILDASGSMWGQVKGKAKIAIAKEVMKKLVDGLPDDMRVGLSAYGHRRKGDCNDIETLIKPGPLNRKALKAKIDSISPKGKTPLSEAVRRAAQEMRYIKERATVVLVSDGLETCAADPCKLAAELAKAGVDFTVHVIGFAITKDEQERLRCLADRTGGLFLAADDAAGLQKALSTTVAKVKEAPKPVVEDPGKAKLTGPAQVPVGQAFQVKWEGPDSKGDYVTLAPKGSKDSHELTHAYTKTGNPVRLTAPGDPGDYELRYKHGATGKVIGRAPLKVIPVPASVEAPAEAAVAQKIQVKWKGPAYQGDYVTIAKPDARPGGYEYYTYVSQGNPLTLQAPADPGSYEVRYIMHAGDKLIAKAPIKITPATAQVKAPAEAAVAQKIKVSWQGPGSDRDYISIAKPDSRPGSYVHYTYVKTGNPVTLQIPSDPGAYEVRYIQGLGDKLLAKTPITVKAVSASVTAPPSANAGVKIQVSWQGPANDRDYVTIAKPDSRPGSYVYYTYVKTGNPLKLQTPAKPGPYEVRYILGLGDKLLAKTYIEIKAVSASVTAPPSANVGAKFKVSWQGPGYERDYISIARPDQGDSGYEHYTYARAGNPLNLQGPAKPGKYEVRYILGQGDKLLAKTPIEIKAVSASVQAPLSADVGVKFKVSWQGPGYERDYISIARPDQGDSGYEHYTYVRAGNPLNLRAPAKPGKYEVRYIMGHGDKLLAKTPITIKAVSASVEPPASANAGAKFKVSWKGPGQEKDYLSIARPDQGEGSYEHYTYVTEGNPLSLQAPTKPGHYEVRYVMGLEDKVLSKKGIEIKAVSASLQPPAEAKAGQPFKVSWKGPGYDNDYICISRTEQGMGAYEEMTWVREGNPLTIKAPEKPGDYEVRYIMGDGEAMLDKKAIKVK